MRKWSLVIAASMMLANEAQAAVNHPAFNRYMLALAVCVAYVLFCLWIFRRHHRAAGKQAVHGDQHGDAWLIGYASQGGYARELALKTAQSMQEAGVEVRCMALSEIDVKRLEQARHALFVVSTTGEGDAPDNAHHFMQTVMPSVSGLPQLQYGLLALGDSSYANFCGFGHQLDHWLQQMHALPLFDMVQVDAGDDGALRHWQYQLGLLAGSSEMPDWQPAQYQSWHLIMRQCLNPGSAGAPVYQLALRPENPDIQWQAGDIAEIGPRNPAHEVRDFLARLELPASAMLDGKPLADDLAGRLLPHEPDDIAALRRLPPGALLQQLRPLPHREYSIASLPGDGQLELLVRQASHADGRLGLGSGWLTTYVEVGEKVALRIRENVAFHPPPVDLPLILIGNGTGIAGLRAHLKARAVNSQAANWLLFGERNAAYDFHFEDEVKVWQAAGVLTRVDAVFSRDQPERQYVQHILARHPDIVSEWVRQGAAIYVCGSASGMAPEVHAVLLEILGENVLAQCALDGRYRRDVY